MSKKKVLVIGSGGREYAFAWKLYQDEEVGEVFCAPGNGGTEKFSTNLETIIFLSFRENCFHFSNTFLDLSKVFSIVRGEAYSLST